jgi:hypothetical protein
MNIEGVQIEIVKFGIRFKNCIDHPIKGKQKEYEVGRQGHIEFYRF